MMKARYKPRIRVKLPVAFTFGSQIGEGQILDLTMPGCLIESSFRVATAQTVHLEMYLPGLQYPISVPLGVVRWTKGKRFGVEFIKMHESQQRTLKQFLARHDTDQRAVDRLIAH
jgi:hypothetical protein